MPLVGGGGEVLSLEDVAQVTLARGAHNLDARAVGVWTLLDGAGHAGVEDWPATARAELLLGVVERLAATDAREGASVGVLGSKLLFKRPVAVRRVKAWSAVQHIQRGMRA